LSAFAAYLGAFATLGGQDVGVTGIGVAPPQVVLKPPGQDGVVGVVGATHDEVAQWPELGLDRSLEAKWA